MAWAAAAAILLVVAGAMLRAWTASEEPIAITQSTYAGFMGDAGAAANVAPEDRNVDLSIAPAAKAQALLLTVDGDGRPLAPPRWFARQADGRLHTVVAPRTFSPHEGRAYGLVLLGERAALEGLSREGAASGGLDDYEAAMRRRGLRVRRVVIGEVSP
jgi:hypothetical protein